MGRARPVDERHVGQRHLAVVLVEAPQHVEPARERLDEVRSRATSCHERDPSQPSESEPGSPNIVPRAPCVLSDW